MFGCATHRLWRTMFPVECFIEYPTRGGKNMALINRVSRLFTADLHAVLDRIEEPDALLRQAIREMEEDLANTEQRIGWLEHERDQLAGRRTEIERSLADVEEQLDVCFQSGEEQLARSLIRRRLESERLARHLETRGAANAQELDSQQTALDENARRLESMRQKAELLTDHAGDEYRSGADDVKREFAVGEDEVDVAFLREKQRRAKA
jgi:phage shock protein A